MEAQQLLFLVILVGSLALFVSEKLRVDLVAMLTLLALSLTGILDAKQALSGFSSEPAIIVATVFVLSAGLSATGSLLRLKRPPMSRTSCGACRATRSASCAERCPASWRGLAAPWPAPDRPDRCVESARRAARRAPCPDGVWLVPPAGTP